MLYYETFMRIRQIQNLGCYRYTMGQLKYGGAEEIRTPETL